MTMELEALTRDALDLAAFRLDTEVLEPAQSPAAAWSILENFGMATGWVQTSERIAVLDSPAIVRPTAGTVLAAELLSAEDRSLSLHLRFRGDGGWRAWRVRRCEPREKEDLGRTESWLTVHPEGGRIQYEVALGLVETGSGETGRPQRTLRPVSFRFAGFAANEEEEQ